MPDAISRRPDPDKLNFLAFLMLAAPEVAILDAGAQPHLLATLKAQKHIVETVDNIDGGARGARAHRDVNSEAVFVNSTDSCPDDPTA